MAHNTPTPGPDATQGPQMELEMEVHTEVHTEQTHMTQAQPVTSMSMQARDKPAHQMSDSDPDSDLEPQDHQPKLEPHQSTLQAPQPLVHQQPAQGTTRQQVHDCNHQPSNTPTSQAPRCHNNQYSPGVDGTQIHHCTTGTSSTTDCSASRCEDCYTVQTLNTFRIWNPCPAHRTSRGQSAKRDRIGSRTGFAHGQFWQCRLYSNTHSYSVHILTLRFSCCCVSC